MALREDEEAAETLGVPVVRYKLVAFVLSAAIPGMVGAVIGNAAAETGGHLRHRRDHQRPSVRGKDQDGRQKAATFIVMASQDR